MKQATPIQTSILLYGGILLAGLVVLALLLINNKLQKRKIARQMELLTAKKQSEEALNQQVMDMAHQQGLQTIGTLTSSIAHEFNNLLTPIMGYSMLALEKVAPEDEELYESLLEIYEAARKAKHIISRLSDISRKKSSLLIKFVDIDNVMRKTAEVIAPIKPQHIEVALDLNCRHTFVLADETRLHQMMLNLCVNALQAMEESEEGLLTIKTHEADDCVYIDVTDTGHGIPKAHLETIFNPFFTTKEAGKGTGLGLAIVQQVVNEVGGDICVSSEVNAGTQILVRIPLPKENTFS